MESGSRSSHSDDAPQDRVANIIGTFIAVITLTLPVGMIGYFSAIDPGFGRPAQVNSPTSGG